MVEDDSWIKRLTNQTVNKAGSQPTNIFLLQSFHFLSVPDPSRALIPIVGRSDVDDMTTHLCHSSNKYHFDSLNNSHSDDSEWYSRSWQSLPKKIIVLCVMIVQFIIFIQFIISWHRWFHRSRCENHPGLFFARTDRAPTLWRDESFRAGRKDQMWSWKRMNRPTERTGRETEILAESSTD